MSTFAETAIVDCCLPCADQGKQTFVFSFHLQQTSKCLLFPFSVYNKQTKVAKNLMEAQAIP
jgi:hypothetical protein